MADDRQFEAGKQKVDYFRMQQVQQWNMVAQHQGKESNALAMNQKIMSILNERDNAIKERNKALAEKKELLGARDAAILERNKAFSERDSALMERDNALAALRFRGNGMNFPMGGEIQCGTKRTHPSINHPEDMAQGHYYMGEVHINDVFPISIVASEPVKSRQSKRTKENKGIKAQSKGKKVGEDLNRHVPSDGKKFKTEWDSLDVGLNLINFDETTMPVPVCSCTGEPHQCYKWGNGGWQSSCCTTTMSSYPLPQLPNKRHARIGGRKMSGSVFTRLLSRLAGEGHDLSVPLDLKDYWARHGTNRYITIK